ncbi:MAG: SPFH domain-containing protein [Bacteroidales bacterium]|nr:SPFH domain-containing protein [Bacteroidales bacterium]
MNLQHLNERKRYSSFLFERALPNEYLVVIGKSKIKPVLGGTKFRWFNKFIHVPAYVQRLKFLTDNANIHYQGIEIQGYASWRINPEFPEKSISTLDFFNENDPMAKTNEELKTICIEAVRHVIANMTIDDALKKKDDIAESLIVQLKTIEDKWGIIFDQVGIEQVRIMSDTLFHDLQSEFRGKLRLSAEITNIETEREIAKRKNETDEKNTQEKIESKEKLESIKIESESRLKKKELIEEKNINEQKRIVQEEAFRQDIAFRLEQEEKEHEFNLMVNKLKTELNKLDIKLFETTNVLEEVKSEIVQKQLKLKEIEQKIDQSYSPEKLNYELINMLPKIFESIKIDNYSVLECGNETISSPIIKLINEIIFASKNFKMGGHDKE